MPAVNAPAPERAVFRSRPAMVTAGVLATVLVGASLVGWAGLGPVIRAQFTIPQILTLLFFLAVMVGGMFAIALSSVTAGPDGVTLRNVLFRQHYGWDQVKGVQLGDGDAWAYLLIAPDENDPDSRTQMAMGIQRSDPAAPRHIETLRAMIAANTRPGQPR